MSLQSLKDLEDWLGRQTEVFKAGHWIALEGEMGVGKTSLVRSFLRSKAFKDPVPSPSFPIQLEYEIDSLRVIHVDAFRLDPSHTDLFDFDDWKDALVFVEWPKNFSLPPEAYHYRIEIFFDGEARILEIHKLKDDLSESGS